MRSAAWAGVGVFLLMMGVEPQALASPPEVLAQLGSKGAATYRTEAGIWFNARLTPSGSPALGFTDGTVSGTRLLSVPGLPTSAILHGLGSERAIFAVGTQLWGTDLTVEGTRPIGPAFEYWGDDDRDAIIHGTLVYRTTDDAHGTELWRSDGTPEGTYLLGDICPGPQGSQPRLVAIRDHFVYFGAWACAPKGVSPDGYVLYRTDGRTISVVGDISPPEAEYGPGGGVVLRDGIIVEGTVLGSTGSALVFQTPTGLSATDGTADNVVPLPVPVIHWRLYEAADRSERFLGIPSDPFVTPQEENTDLFVLAEGVGAVSCHVRRLWTTDGTVAGTHDRGLVDYGAWDFMMSRSGSVIATQGRDSIWVTDGITPARPALKGANVFLGAVVGDRLIAIRQAPDGSREIVGWTVDVASLPEADLGVCPPPAPSSAGAVEGTPTPPESTPSLPSTSNAGPRDGGSASDRDLPPGVAAGVDPPVAPASASCALSPPMQPPSCGAVAMIAALIALAAVVRRRFGSPRSA